MDTDFFVNVVAAICDMKTSNCLKDFWVKFLAA